MKKFSFILPAFFLILLSESFSQKSDTLKTIPDTSKKHSPMIATIMSAIVPGLGQVYNKKYWKVPVIYGGLLTAGYFLKFNRTEFLYFKNNYIAEADTFPETVNISNFSKEALQSYMDFYRTRMEICYIALGMLYVLNIVDATVDAHLFTFDVSDNLSMNIRPEIYQSFSNNIPLTGFKLTLKL